MFFVPYIIFQPPMTILIRKIGPTVFLGTIVMTWAVIMIVCVPPIHPGQTLTSSIGNRVREGLGPAGRPASLVGRAGSGLLPGLRVSTVLLVYSM